MCIATHMLRIESMLRKRPTDLHACNADAVVDERLHDHAFQSAAQDVQAARIV